MVYSEKMVVCIVCKGDVLREVKSGQGESDVFLPFGSDYSIRLKNLNTQRAVVKVSIDGKDVLNGDTLLIGANEDMELQGFLEGTVAKNAFRFIEKTKQISEHRGNRMDDGIVRIEWQYEEKPATVVRPVIVDPIYVRPWGWYNDWYWGGPRIGGGITYGPNTTYGSSPLRGSNCNDEPDDDFDDTLTLGDEETFSAPTKGMRGSKGFSGPSGASVNNFNHEVKTSGLPVFYDAPKNEDGITVKGQQINQNFRTAYAGTLETEKHVMIIKLRGSDENPQTGKVVKVQQPVQVRRDIKCETCGICVKSSAKFCQSCGTFVSK